MRAWLGTKRKSNRLDKTEEDLIEGWNSRVTDPCSK